ncbi:MAG: peptide ABC transporter substrate-binding protein [Phycisphaerales bacterium]
MCDRRPRGSVFRFGRSTVAVVAGIAALSVAAVGGLTLAARTAGNGGAADLTLVNTNEVYTLDPQRMSFLGDLRMAGALHEPLLRLDPDTGVPSPAAATGWTVSDDGLEYVFTLRPDGRWSSGAPVTAADFVYAWRRALLPDTAARMAGLFMTIEGGEAFFAWRAAALEAYAAGDDRTPAAAEALWTETLAAADRLIGLQADGAHTLRVRLERPAPYFPDLVSLGCFSPVWAPAIEGWSDPSAASTPPFADRRFVRLDAASGRLRQDPAWAKPGTHVGNGPYTLNRWRYKRDLRLVAAPTFTGPPAASAIIDFLTIEDANTAVLAFETGRVDWLIDVGTDVKADMLAEAAAGERTNVHAVPAFGTEFFSFNCRPERADGTPNPLADARIRRALVQAVDRSVITESVTRLREPVLTSITPPGSIPGYAPPGGLDLNIDAARAELAAAGWTDVDGDGRVEDAAGAAFPTIEILYTTSAPRSRWIAINLRDQWQRALGIPIDLRAAETKFYRRDLKAGNFMIAQGRWYGDYGDPTTFLDLFRTGEPSNDRGFSDPGIDAGLAAAAAERDPARRMERLAKVERELFTVHAPMLTICQLVQVSMHEPSAVAGIGAHARQAQDLSRIRRLSGDSSNSPDAAGAADAAVATDATDATDATGSADQAAPTDTP